MHEEPIRFHIQQLKAVRLEAVDDIGLHFVRIEDRDAYDKLRDLEEAIRSLESGVVFDAFMALLEDAVIDLHAFQSLFVDGGIQVFHVELRHG